MSFSEEEIEEFKTESRELLDVAETNLLALDNGAEFRTSFDAVFRSFHNLKGAAGMMELVLLKTHTHGLENILVEFKDKTEMPKKYISFFLKGVDGARALLNGEAITFNYDVDAGAGEASVSAVAQEQPEIVKAAAPIGEKAENVPVEAPDIIAVKPQAADSGVDPAVQEFIAESEEIIERVSKSLQRIESDTNNRESIEELYRDVHSLKGSAYLFSFNTMGDIGHKVESSLENVRNGTHQISKELVSQVYKCMDALESELRAIKTKVPDDMLQFELPELFSTLEKLANSLLIVNEVSVKSDSSTVQEVSVPAQSVSAQPVQAVQNEIKPMLSQPKKQDNPVSNENQSSAPKDKDKDKEKDKDNEASSSIRVSVSLLDNLMTLMGEMVLVRNQVIQFSSKTEDLEFLTLSKRLNVVTSEIQAEMMKTRMQPIGNILTKFNRVVRDLSQELSKDIGLNLIGADTELDKSLLEAIKDPLTHIVRNSCDHGIETPEVRVAAGKQKNGTIQIRSYHEGGQVVIEIRDDGKGLHKEVLIKKALEKSLITPSQAASMSEKEIFNLIFAPGFSTAASVTNVSGRGVGMDVVRTNVERIGGSVELNSVTGKGTTTKLKIPLTLAIVPALIVHCGGGTFAIPQVKLEELVRVDQTSADSKIEFLHGAPVYRLRGNILPLVSLNQILGISAGRPEINAISNIAVLNADQCAFGLIVDEIQDTADIVVKPINRLLKSLQVYSGATILGDGSIALILDVFGISKVAQIGNENSKGEELSNARSDQKRAEINEHQEFLLVRVNSPTKHAIVLGYVHRLEEFKVSKIEMSGSQRVVRYGNSILPIISVSQQLGLGVSDAEKNKENIPIVVIQKAGALYGLQVEEIIDTLSTSIEVDASLVKQVGVFGNLNTPEELIVTIDPFELIQTLYPEAPANQSSLDVEIQTHPTTGGLVSQAQKALNILLVEDAVFFRKAVAKVLTQAGHEVTMAVDGKDAIEFLDKNPKKYDLVVSDIDMPRMNGFELAKAVRANSHYSYLPMLAVSARADKNNIDEGLEAGFNIYLEKLKPSILLEAVSKLTKSQKRAG